MTIREGWPPFEVWQRGLRLKRITVRITYNFIEFAEAAKRARDAFARLTNLIEERENHASS